MQLPSLRGIYYLARHVVGDKDDFRLFFRHRAPRDRKKKYSRLIGPYFAARGWDLKKHLTHKRIMDLLVELRAEIDLEAEASAKPPAPPESPLFDLVSDFIGEVKATSTNAQYVAGLERRLRACLGESVRPRETPPLTWRKPSDIDRSALEAYLIARRAAGRSAKECNHDLRSWTTFEAWMVRRGMVSAHRLRDMRALKEPERPPKVLTPEQLAALLAECRRKGVIEENAPGEGAKRVGKYRVPDAPEWLYPAVLIMSCTGMRPVELARLEWAQVDLERRTATVLRKGGRHWHVELVPELVRLLGAVKKKDRVGRVVPGFPYYAGKARPQGYMKAVQTAARRAGLEGVTLYWLRHSVATYLAKAGESSSRLAVLMGWTSPRMAERYVHLAGQDVRGALHGLPWVAPEADGSETGSQKRKKRRV